MVGLDWQVNSYNMAQQTKGGQYIEKLCKKFTKTPTFTLAKKAYAENSELFKNLENARALVRAYRGEQKYSLNEKRVTRRSVPASKNPFVIPKSKNEEREPYDLTPGKWLILNDIHFPFHCEKSLDKAINYGLKNGFNRILLNGDTMDMYKKSRFEQDPRKPSIQAEFQMTRDFLKSCSEHFGEIIYKIGNHDERWEKWLIAKAPELLDCEDFELKVLLRFGEYGVKEVLTKQLMNAGNLVIAHGHELPTTTGGVNPARTMFLKANTSIAVGHFHRTSSHVERNVHNHITSTHSIGCLCHLSPDYMPYNNWNNGFATVEFNKEGEYTFENKKIIQNKIY